jgi:hypothetical protein
MNSSVRHFPIPDKAIPTPHPDGGVFYLFPMTQLDIKRLAKRIVRFEYLTDKRGKTVFNQKGNAVPKFDQDDEAVIVEAFKRVDRITDVAIPVFVDGEQQYDDVETGGERVPRTVLVMVNGVDEVCGEEHTSLEGRCPTRIKGKAGAVQCARIIVGDFVSTAREVMSTIFAGSYQYEEDIKDEVDAAGVAKAEDATPEVDVDEPDPDAKKPKTRKVVQLVAEWAVDECAKLGESRHKEALKN